MSDTSSNNGNSNNSSNSIKETITAFVQSLPKIVLLNVAAGLACGLVIGVPPMLIHFQAQLANCLLATSEKDCGSVSPHVCSWDKTHSVCIGSITTCDPNWALTKCNAANNCAFSTARNQCEQNRGWGWNNGEMGFFASAATFGAVLGTFVASSTARHDQMKRLGHAAACFVIGSILAWALWIFTNPHSTWGALGFVLAGVGMGVSMSLAPAIVSSVVAPHLRGVCGTIFQLSITLGICGAALTALIFEKAPSVAPHFLLVSLSLAGAACYYVSDAVAAPLVVDHFMRVGGGGGMLGGDSSIQSAARISGGGGDDEQQHDVLAGGGPPIEISSGPPSLAGGTIAATAAATGGVRRISSLNINNDSTSTLGANADGADSASDTSNLVSPGQPPPPHSRTSTAAPSPTVTGTGSIANNNNNATTIAMSSIAARNSAMVKTAYIAGIVLGTSLQSNGINAVMNFASQMTRAAGLDNPLVGNFIIMLWNALACLPAIPLASRYQPSQLYLVGMAAGSGCCFLVALAMVAGSPAFALICILGFILCFESLLGPFFFSLMTEIFPPELRSTAASRVTLVNFAWNIVIVFIYPSLCDWLTTSGDASTGVRNSFIVFGCFGWLCGGLLYVLFPRTYLKMKADTPPGTGEDE